MRVLGGLRSYKSIDSEYTSDLPQPRSHSSSPTRPWVGEHPGNEVESPAVPTAIIPLNPLAPNSEGHPISPYYITS